MSLCSNPSPGSLRHAGQRGFAAVPVDLVITADRTSPRTQHVTPAGTGRTRPDLGSREGGHEALGAPPVPVAVSPDQLLQGACLGRVGTQRLMLAGENP